VADGLEDDPEVAVALQAGDYEGALRTLLRRAEAANDHATKDAVRDLMVRIFLELGQDHPLAASFRKKLAAALY